MPARAGDEEAAAVERPAEVGRAEGEGDEGDRRVVDAGEQGGGVGGDERASEGGGRAAGRREHDAVGVDRRPARQRRPGRPGSTASTGRRRAGARPAR